MELFYCVGFPSEVFLSPVSNFNNCKSFTILWNVCLVFWYPSMPLFNMVPFLDKGIHFHATTNKAENSTGNRKVLSIKPVMGLLQKKNKPRNCLAIFFITTGNVFSFLLPSLHRAALSLSVVSSWLLVIRLASNLKPFQDSPLGLSKPSLTEWTAGFSKVPLCQAAFLTSYHPLIVGS